MKRSRARRHRRDRRKGSLPELSAGGAGEGCELSAAELAKLDEAIAEADAASERGELYSADQVLAEMREIGG